MKHLLLLLAICTGLAACDDIIFTDGRTIARGYVTDSLTGQPVPGAKLYLLKCNSSVIFFGDRCRDVLDSAVTNADGYYQFRFRDQRKTDFGLMIGSYLVNNFEPLPLSSQPNGNAPVVDDEYYLVKEGKKNQFDFYVKSFKTVEVNLRINTPGYERFGIYTRYESIYFNAPAVALDTTLYVRALPKADFQISGHLFGTGKPEIRAEKVQYIDMADTTRLDLAF